VKALGNPRSSRRKVPASIERKKRTPAIENRERTATKMKVSPGMAIQVMLHVYIMYNLHVDCEAHSLWHMTRYTLSGDR